MFEGDSLHDYFAYRSGGIESHLYIRYDGKIEQYRDFDYEADAQYKGNSWIDGAHRNGFISIETEGMGSGTWTPEQLASIKAVLLWLSKRYNFPLQRCPSMQPTSPSNGGVGYHSQYVGWSNVVGKTCPGSGRIDQFKNVLIPWMKDPQEDDMTPNEMWTELSTHEAWFIDKARQAVQSELGDENVGAFSDRVAQKVLAALPPAPAPAGATVDLDALAAKVADLLSERLKG